MALLAKRWSFTRSLVQDAPEHPGVYALWDRDTLVHLGAALGSQTIRDCLLGRLEHAGRARITHYSWELSREPLARLRELSAQLREPEGELRTQ